MANKKDGNILVIVYGLFISLIFTLAVLPSWLKIIFSIILIITFYTLINKSLNQTSIKENSEVNNQIIYPHKYSSANKHSSLSLSQIELFNNPRKFESMDEDVYNYLIDFINNYPLILNSKKIEDIKLRGSIDDIYNLDELAVYYCMTTDTIIHYLEIIRGGLLNHNGRKLLSPNYLEYFFPDYNNYYHRHHVETYSDSLIAFHRHKLFKSKVSDEHLLENSYFKSVFTILLKIEALACIIGEHYDVISKTNFGRLDFASLTDDSIINLAYVLIEDIEVLIEDTPNQILYEAELPSIKRLEKITTILFQQEFTVVGLSHRRDNVDNALKYLSSYTVGFNEYLGFSDKEILLHKILVFQYHGLKSQDFKLIPEPDNAHDSNAVKVVVGDGIHIGYISRSENKEIFNYLVNADKYHFDGILKVVGGPMKRYETVFNRVTENKFSPCEFKVNIWIEDKQDTKDEPLKI